MGFSVSGSTVIIVIGLLVAGASLYTGVNSAHEAVTDAHTSQHESIVQASNTALDTKATDYAAPSARLTIIATNTGSRSIDLSQMTIVVNGEYLSQNDWTTNTTGTAWYAGESIEITADWNHQPQSVRLVTATGVADHYEVR